MNEPPQHPCKSCGQWHPLFEQTHRNASRHHFYWCDISRKRFYVPRTEGLVLPEKPTRKALREAGQLSLL